MKQETDMPRCATASEPALSTFLKQFSSLTSVRALVLPDPDLKPPWVILLHEPIFTLEQSLNFRLSISRTTSSTHLILESKTLRPDH